MTYHIGRIAFVCKMMKNKHWNNLSIAKG
ncbi:MAG: DUF1572 family protein [Bacteroidota bacterium]